MPTEDNKFVDRLYQDFEQKLFKVLGFGIEGLRIAIDLPESEARPRHSVDDRLNVAFERGGAPQLRWQMNNELAPWAQYIVEMFTSRCSRFLPLV